MVAADCWFANRDDINVCIIVFRVCLAYGGSDVTRTFFWLLQRAGFPYKECQLANRLDCQLLQHLKETLCHLEQVPISRGERSVGDLENHLYFYLIFLKNQFKCVMR